MRRASWATLSHEPICRSHKLAQKPWKRAHHALPSHCFHQHFSKSACRHFIYLSTFFGVVLSKRKLIPSILKTKEKVDAFFSPGRSGTDSSPWEPVRCIISQVQRCFYYWSLPLDFSSLTLLLHYLFFIPRPFPSSFFSSYLQLYTPPPVSPPRCRSPSLLATRTRRGWCGTIPHPARSHTAGKAEPVSHLRHRATHAVCWPHLGDQARTAPLSGPCGTMCHCSSQQSFSAKLPAKEQRNCEAGTGDLRDDYLWSCNWFYHKDVKQDVEVHGARKRG